MKYIKYSSLALLLLILPTQIFAAKDSDSTTMNLLRIVQQYADAMITDGRDTYGKVQSPLFASALDPESMKLDSGLALTVIPGVRKTDRSITGANMIHDIALFQILYELSDLTGNQKYANEADEALEFFLNHCQSETTGLMCWGEHLFWDFDCEDCGFSPNYDMHETSAWPFWENAYRLAPDACWNFAISEWDHQIHNKTTGDFSRHARYTTHETFSGFDFPRYAGQMIERWSMAYSRPENADQPRREELLTAITILFNRMIENAKLSASGYLIAGRSLEGDHVNLVWLTSNVELARCLEQAAPTVPSDLSEKMLAFALKQDMDFLNAPHKLDSAEGGFAVTLHAQTGLPRFRSMNRPYTSTWSSGYGYGTHAGVANMCFERHQNYIHNQPEMAERYKIFMLTAAERYLTSTPIKTELLKPNEYSDAIELMLNCYELSGHKKYLDRAVFFANEGVELFLDNISPLPKATNQHAHYESITGGPDFMYQLLQLQTVLDRQ